MAYVLVGVVTNNLNRVLVSTNGTISTQTVELSLEHASTTEGNLFNLRQRGNVYVSAISWFPKIELSG